MQNSLILKYQKNKFSGWKAQAEFKEAWREKKKEKNKKYSVGS